MVIAPTRTAAPARHRFTVDEWHQMIDAGVFGPEDRVELLDGEVVDMAAIGRKHANRTRRLGRLFHRQVGDRAVVDQANPVVLDDGSEPEPDLMLLRERPDGYAALPTAADVLLVVEVSDSSLDYDLRDKAAAYARNGVPEYWVGDVIADTLVVHRDPSPTGYQSVQTMRGGQRLWLVALPDFEVAVADLLG